MRRNWSRVTHTSSTQSSWVRKRCPKPATLAWSDETSAAISLMAPTIGAMRPV